MDKKQKGKLYLLRHEQRGNDISFLSSLTVKGQVNSATLISPKLRKCGISTIYCSPFTRTLQTIYHFSVDTKIPVNIEWALAESYPFDPTIPDEFNYIINPNYESFCEYESPHSEKLFSTSDLKLRVKHFIETLDFSLGNILLVTHLPVINAILLSKGVEIVDIFKGCEPGTLICIE